MKHRTAKITNSPLPHPSTTHKQNYLSTPLPPSHPPPRLPPTPSSSKPRPQSRPPQYHQTNKAPPPPKTRPPTATPSNVNYTAQLTRLRALAGLRGTGVWWCRFLGGRGGWWGAAVVLRCTIGRSLYVCPCIVCIQCLCSGIGLQGLGLSRVTWPIAGVCMGSVWWLTWFKIKYLLLRHSYYQ